MVRRRLDTVDLPVAMEPVRPRRSIVGWVCVPQAVAVRTLALLKRIPDPSDGVGVACFCILDLVVQMRS